MPKIFQLCTPLAHLVGAGGVGGQREKFLAEMNGKAN